MQHQKVLPFLPTQDQLRRRGFGRPSGHTGWILEEDSAPLPGLRFSGSA